jgi:hypothetical protein
MAGSFEAVVAPPELEDDPELELLLLLLLPHAASANASATTSTSRVACLLNLKVALLLSP